MALSFISSYGPRNRQRRFYRREQEYLCDESPTAPVFIADMYAVPTQVSVLRWVTIRLPDIEILAEPTVVETTTEVITQQTVLARALPQTDNQARYNLLEKVEVTRPVTLYSFIFTPASSMDNMHSIVAQTNLYMYRTTGHDIGQFMKVLSVEESNANGLIVYKVATEIMNPVRKTTMYGPLDSMVLSANAVGDLNYVTKSVTVHAQTGKHMTPHTDFVVELLNASDWCANKLVLLGIGPGLLATITAVTGKVVRLRINSRYAGFTLAPNTPLSSVIRS